MLPFKIDKEHSHEANFETGVDKYPVYSVIHSMYESFNFHVYNGSHKCHNQLVHRSSMCTLKFPSDVGMFVLFHGNLVHNGALTI